MSQHLDRRFKELKRKATTRFTSVGIIIRLIILLAVLLGGKLFCDKMTEKSIQYHSYERGVTNGLT